MASPGYVLRAGRYVAVAWEFIGTIAAGAAVGWFLDGRVTPAPWGMTACVLGAVVGAFVRLLQVLRRIDRLDGEREP